MVTIISQSYLIQPTTDDVEIVVATDQVLTPSELTVLTLLANGSANKQIARYMGNTERTVKKHSSSARAKLGALNRVHMIALAVARGFVEVQL